MINFSKISKNTLLGGLLRFFLKFIPKNSVVLILQGRLRGKKWIKNSGVNGYWLGSYELEQTKNFEKLVKEGDVVFDIGANVGFYSLLAAELVGEKGKVFVFEPLFQNYEYLRKHIELNGYKNIKPFNIAISDKEGKEFFSKSLSSATGHLVDSGEIKVNTIAIDDWIKEKKLPIPNILKIDVEGAEDLVLKGAQSILKKFKPLIFLSLHSEKAKNNCFEILRNCGYNLETKENLFIF